MEAIENCPELQSYPIVTKISESLQIEILALKRTKYFMYSTEEIFEYFVKIHFSFSSNKVIHIMSTQRKEITDIP